MRKRVLHTATAIAFLGSVAVATAAELNLTAQQKQTIAQGVQNSSERIVGLLTTIQLQLLFNRLESDIGLLNGVIQRGNACYAHDAFS